VPVRYVCRKCGFVLWKFEHVGQDYYGVPTPEEIRRVYGVCPNCKSELAIPSIEDIVIEAIAPKKRLIEAAIAVKAPGRQEVSEQAVTA